MWQIRVKWKKQGQNNYQAELAGPAGTIRASRLAVEHDDPEYLEYLYWECVKTVKGYYHCCLSGWVEWLDDNDENPTKLTN